MKDLSQRQSIPSCQVSLPGTVLHCHHCHHRIEIPTLFHGQKANCPHCNHLITVFKANNLDWLLSLSIAGLMLLVLTLPFDFLSFTSRGQTQVINIPSSLYTLVDQDYFALALLEALAILILPLGSLLGLIYLITPLKFGRQAKARRRVYHWVMMLLPWGMAEIFIIGVLVSLVKIISLADVTLGPSFYAFIAFSLCMATLFWRLDRHHLQMMLGLDLHHMPKPLTAASRKAAIQRTWAYLIAAVVFYVPANTFPIMTTRFLGQDEPSTILGGVVLLWESGSYPIALVIFVASVLVPVAKIVVLSWLNYTVQTQETSFKRQRTLFYRTTEFVGRWSMVDVFVVAILVSLIRLGNVMSIYPGPAALAFSAVVIITMLAAISFDPRLIWQTEVSHGRQ